MIAEVIDGAPPHDRTLAALQFSSAGKTMELGEGGSNNKHWKRNLAGVRECRACAGLITKY